MAITTTTKDLDIFYYPESLYVFEVLQFREAVLDYIEKHGRDPDAIFLSKRDYLGYDDIISFLNKDDRQPLNSQMNYRGIPVFLNLDKLHKNKQ